MFTTEHGFAHAMAPINHPLADEISISMGPQISMARFPYTVEIAFFRKNEWVNEVLPEFAYFAMDSSDTVYGYVPTDKVFEFLHRFSPMV